MPIAPLALALALFPQLQSDWIPPFLGGSRALEAGDLEEAIAALGEVQERLPGHGPSVYLLACAHSRRGAHDRAFDWLKRAEAAGQLEAAQLEWDPWLDAVRDDPRFTVLLEGTVGVTVDDKFESHSAKMLAAGRLRTSETVARSRPTAWIGAEDGSLRELDLETGRTLWSIPVSENAIVSLDLRADDGELVLVDELGRVRSVDITDPDRGSSQRVKPAAATRWRRFKVQMAPCGGRALLSLPDGSLALLDVNEGEQLASLPRKGRRSLLACWSPDGRQFAVGNEEKGLVHLYDARDGSRLGLELRIRGTAWSLAFEPSGARLWIGDAYSRVSVFELATGALVRRLDHWDLDGLDIVEVASIRFGPQGHVGVTASSGFGVVAAWDTRTGKRLWGYAYNGGNPSSLRTVFGEKGEQVFVSGQSSGTARIVDARTGAIRLDLAEFGLGRIWPVAGEEGLLARTRRGLECRDTREGRLLWSRTEHEDDGWILRASSGHVDGTHAALARALLVIDDESAPLLNYAAVLLDPAKVRASAAGIVLAPASLP